MPRDVNRDPVPGQGSGWLRLRRRHGEGILIGDDVEVRVDMDGREVFLVIRAPGQRVVRTELLERGGTSVRRRS